MINHTCGAPSSRVFFFKAYTTPQIISMGKGVSFLFFKASIALQLIAVGFHFFFPGVHNAATNRHGLSVAWD